MVDEFQFLSYHNLQYFQQEKNWERLILMSATPEVPFLKTAELQSNIVVKRL